MIILVSLKTDDGEGSAILACTGIKKDPLLPDNRVLENVVGLLWPFGDQVLRVSQWSVNKKSINHWMVGQLHNRDDSGSLTLEDLEKARQAPHPPGTLPEQPLTNDVEGVEELKAFAAKPKKERPPRKKR